MAPEPAVSFQIASSLIAGAAVVLFLAWVWRSAAAWDRAQADLRSDHPVIGGER